MLANKVPFPTATIELLDGTNAISTSCYSILLNKEIELVNDAVHLLDRLIQNRQEANLVHATFILSAMATEPLHHAIINILLIPQLDM